MPIPLIGVTTWRALSSSGYPQVSISEAYVSALIQAGAYPIMLLSYQDEERRSEILPHLDGVLFTGGGDIAASLYGAPEHPRVTDVDLVRDRFELSLLDHARAEGIPYFGICRGLQLVNVGLGGTLYADILEQRPGAIDHDQDAGHPRDYLAHPVTILPGSRLAEILGVTSARVNSLHHQGIDQLAPGLFASAFAPDGLVEAVEQPGHPFGLAVQWHPENLTAHTTMQALFKAFVEAASQSKLGR